MKDNNLKEIGPEFQMLFILRNQFIEGHSEERFKNKKLNKSQVDLSNSIIANVLMNSEVIDEDFLFKLSKNKTESFILEKTLLFIILHISKMLEKNINIELTLKGKKNLEKEVRLFEGSFEDELEVYELEVEKDGNLFKFSNGSSLLFKN